MGAAIDKVFGSEDCLDGPGLDIGKMMTFEEEKQEYENVLKEIARDNNRARTKLAWFKLSGYGGAEVDESGAVALLNERVADKDAEAMWMLGLCCEYGMGCEQDLKRAESLYTQSAEGECVIGKLLAENGKDGRGSGVMKVADSL